MKITKIIKTISHIILLFLLSAATMQGQGTLNEQKMDREIRIGEKILNEIFHEGRDTNSFFTHGPRAVHGEYVPGIGVHFTISGNTAYGIRYHQNSGAAEGNTAGSDDTSGGVSRDEVRRNITDYFTTYAPLISQLPDDEAVRVTYGINRRGSGFMGLFNEGRGKGSGAAFTMWVNAADLKRFKDGGLSETRFTDRINEYDLSEVDHKTDLNVFASVLEASLNDAGTEHLKVSRKPRADYLPDMGVHYHLHVTARPDISIHGLRIYDDDFEFNMDSISIDLSIAMESLSESMAPLAESMQLLFEGEITRAERDSIRKEAREIRQKVRSQRDSIRNIRINDGAVRNARADSLDLSADARIIMDQLQSVLGDYGSTLKSLPDDEMLMITLNWSGRDRNLPQRTEVRIKKADLLDGKQPDIEDIMRR